MSAAPCGALDSPCYLALNAGRRGSAGAGPLMARSTTDLPRMQNQARTRAPLERTVSAVSQVIEKAAKPKPAKPQMMRQYDLIERVRRYNPNTNEPLLNRAYVYAMKAHG